MSTFDTSGMTPTWPEPIAPPAAEETGGGFDSLALLRGAVAEQTAIEPVTIPVPGVGVRLVCHTEITSRQLSSWQKKSLPKSLQNSPRASVLDMDQKLLAVAVLVNTLLRIEVTDPRQPGEWLPVVDSRTDEPLTFAHPQVLDMFGAMDTTTALKKLFGRESAMVKASRMVTQAAGWGDDELVVAEDPELDPS